MLSTSSESELDELIVVGLEKVVDLVGNAISVKDAGTKYLIRSGLTQIKIVINENADWLTYNLQSYKEQSFTKQPTELRDDRAPSFKIGTTSSLLVFAVDFIDHMLCTYVKDAETKNQAYEVLATSMLIFKNLVGNERNLVIRSIQAVCDKHNKSHRDAPASKPKAVPKNMVEAASDDL